MRMRYPAAVYNFGPPTRDRGPDDNKLQEELGAILEDVVFLAGMEAIGWRDLPKFPDFDLVRDRSDESRANLCAYLRKDLGFDPDDEVWLQMAKTWKATDHPGQHPPRAILKLPLPQGRKFFVAHNPPLTRLHDTGQARKEHNDALRVQLAPWTRSSWPRRTPADQKRARSVLRACFSDPNVGPDGLDPKGLAQLIGGTFGGGNIEGVTVVGGTVTDVHFEKRVQGVPMGTDHGHVMFATVVAGS